MTPSKKGPRSSKPKKKAGGTKAPTPRFLVPELLFTPSATDGAVPLIVKFKVTGIARQLKLERMADGAVMVLPLANDVASVTIQSGQYALQWLGKAASPGDAYTLEIVAPPSAAWKPTLKADDHANCIGVHVLTVS